MSTQYSNPLIERYSSKEMSAIFSPQKKFSTWRKLWVALAEVEQELGLNITDEQIAQMKANIEDIDFARAAEHEKIRRHDVMAHVHTFGEQCPDAMPIIHLGATSAYVGDNTDLIQMKEALELVRVKLVNLLSKLRVFSLEYKALPTLGYTHFQPAQCTTVGKRATLWMMDLVMDYHDITFLIETMKFRGVKGTTGTQASYLALFDGDHEKVKALDAKIAEKFGFAGSLAVTGQTYTRKIDARVAAVLSGLAQSMHKMTNDLRLLQHMKEVEEPFAKNQIGSSAMAYKRNPMRSERIAALSRFVMSSAASPAMTQSTQWFERTLDDSANKRLSIPEAFLAVDAILDIGNNVTTGLVVYPKVIEKHMMAELPFMATENIIMEAVKRGGDRQELHESIRVHSMEAARQVKEFGLQNDLLERIVKDPVFGLNESDIEALLNPMDYIGRSDVQVVEFNETEVDPIIEMFKDQLGEEVELKV